MKIIEGMKLIKELQLKAKDLRKKISENCAKLDFETSLYTDPQGQIKEWLQGHSDVVKEILSLRSRIQKTNVKTDVTIEIGGKQVKKTIAEWIHRRRDLATEELSAWQGLTDRGLKEQRIQTTPGGAVTEIKIQRFFDPLKRDEMVEMYRSEPGIIDRNLEIVNATTDLVN